MSIWLRAAPLGAIAAIVASAATSAQAADPLPRAHEAYSKGILFRVDRNGSKTSWVFGTIHSNDPRVVALPPAVASAFAQARSFAPEIALTDVAAGQFADLAQLDDGHTLADYFDAATLAAIGRALGDGGAPRAAYERLKPWAVLLKLAQARSSPDAPTLDGSLLAAAQARRMQIIGLEFDEEQASAFDAIPLDTQVALVRYLLRERDALAGDHAAVVDAWLARDLARLAWLADAPARADPSVAPHFALLARHLIDDRSATMAYRLFLPLRHGGVFVAIGALHLYGRSGLLARLHEQGYRVRRVY